MRNLLLMSLLLAGIAGCATSPTTQTAQSDRPCEQCLVCKKNADLACVDVAVDKDTPRYVYQGKTYYFCSDECRNAFIQNPQAYLPDH